MIKGFYTTPNSEIFWYAKPRGKDKYQITEYYKYGKLKGQAITRPHRRYIPEERRKHWIKYRR